MSQLQPLHSTRENILLSSNPNSIHQQMNLTSHQRLASTQRIISPTNIANNYPHLKAENSVFGSNNKRQTTYLFGQAIPGSYAGQSNKDDIISQS